MPRLPQVGGDANNWGKILNEYLSVAHSADGSLRPLNQSQITGLQADLSNKFSKSGGLLTGSVKVDGVGNTATLPLGRPQARATGIAINSSFQGGEDSGSGVDTTGRLNLYSYQRAQTGSFGETIRHFLMRADAKAMNAWYMPKAGYKADETPDEA